MPLQYWKDAEAAFVAKAQDTGRAPRKRKKKLPKGATPDSEDEDQHEASAPQTKKSKPVKPNSKSMTSKSSTASSQNKLSNSAAEVAPPNHVQNVDTARVPSDCEDNAIEAQLSHVDGGSINSDRKKKSLLGRWLTHKQKPPEEDDANSNDKTIERNMHVKVEMKEKRDNRELLSDLVDYRVVAINNKTYNKLYLCEKGRQAWSKNTGHKKNRVLLQMITYDHFKQKWQVCDPSDGTKWTKTESYYVLVDAGDIHDVVGKLSED
jgi:hypothetical protein